MTDYATIGRVNQKERTRAAIIEAARDLSGSGTEITMSVVAATARVSEATAYRYFPDLASLLLEAWAAAPRATVSGPREPVGSAPGAAPSRAFSTEEAEG